MEKFPMINQSEGYTCASACVINILYYYGKVVEFNDKDLYDLMLENFKNLDQELTMFNKICLIFDKIDPNFECIYKNCSGQLKKLEKYLKFNIQQKLPVLIAIKTRDNPNCTHIVCVVGYNESYFKYFDPDPRYRIEKVNYLNNEFQELLQGGKYDTIILKKKS